MIQKSVDRVTTQRRRLRELLASKRFYPMPGGFSPIFAKLAEKAGYECFFLAGSQLAAYLYGVADNGFIGVRDVVDHARHMAAAVDIPILVDCDTGYGNAVNAHYAVEQVIASGVAGLQIEDQEAPKKSSIGAGRRCVSRAEAIGKLKAAVAARDALDPEFVICARCDVLGRRGRQLRGGGEPLASPMWRKPGSISSGSTHWRHPSRSARRVRACRRRS